MLLKKAIEEDIVIIQKFQTAKMKQRNYQNKWNKLKRQNKPSKCSIKRQDLNINGIDKPEQRYLF